jgi:hypothetical protein
VSQCACDKGYSGESCDVYCDPKTCLRMMFDCLIQITFFFAINLFQFDREIFVHHTNVDGTCQRTLQAEREAMFDDPFTTHDDVEQLLSASNTVCKCSGFWDGPHCDRYALFKSFIICYFN